MAYDYYRFKIYIYIITNIRKLFNLEIKFLKSNKINFINHLGFQFMS
jgi:hypothetical protein